MTTFSEQAGLPSLPVPPLAETLDKYLKSASALLSERQIEDVRESVEQFKNSQLGKQLQEALENRSKEKRNWLDEWWYEAYNDIREPLAPFVSFGALNSLYQPVAGSQLIRAADVAYGWVQVWDTIRKEQWPITRNRGTTWDMIQFHNLFNSNRTPARPRDKIERFFKTESAGECPSFFIVNCRGVLYKVYGIGKNGQPKSPDELYHEFKLIDEVSDDNREECIVSLSTMNRDVWADNLTHLVKLSKMNAENVRDIQKSMFFLSLSDEVTEGTDELLHEAMLSRPWLGWQDKCIGVVVNRDGQVLLQGDHSNIDAIVLLQAHDRVASYVRKDPKQPKKLDEFELPKRLNFNVDKRIREQIIVAKSDFEKTKSKFRVKAVNVSGFGNDRCRAAKVYTDTVVQIGLQLAFAKTHGFLAPIYETASTRKFYQGRTETVRGCTTEFVDFQQAVLKGTASRAELQGKFLAAVKAHDYLMAECMNGKGFDRHLMGLRKTLELMNGKGCSPKRALPKFMVDEAWKTVGGDGNFLLSTSFIGYMNGDEAGTFGYVCAMRADGYGCFYKIGKNRVLVTISDYVGTKSKLDSFGSNIQWALGYLQTLLPEPKITSNL